MRGYILAVLAAICWSSMGIWGALAFDLGMEPLLLVTLRALIAAFVLLATLYLGRRKIPRLDRRDLFFFTAFGLFGVAFNYLSYFYAIKLTSVSVAVILLYTYPTIVTVVARGLFKEEITRVKLLALTVTALGIILVVGISRSAIEGIKVSGVIFGLFAGLTAATHSIMTKYALKNHSSLATVTYGFAFGSSFLLLLLLTIDPTTLASIPSFPPKLWGIIVALALIPTLLGYFLYTSALNYIEVSRASIVTTIEPVAAIALAYFILAEKLTPTQLIGSILVLSGVLVVRIRRQKTDGVKDNRKI